MRLPYDKDVIELREMSFTDIKNNAKYVLPVTPSSFEASCGVSVETININKLGDVIIPGYETLPTFRVDCMFPAKAYAFNQPRTIPYPYFYVKLIKEWCKNHTMLKFIVSESDVAEDVIITDMSYGERDGTGDVYASISMRRYRKMEVKRISTGNSSRTDEKAAVPPQKYIIKPGDTLSAICRKYYGDASLYLKLAKYNGIKNANLIYVGRELKLPKKSLL